MRYIYLIFIVSFILLTSCGVRKDVYYARKNAEQKPEVPEQKGKKKKPKYVYGENIPDRPKEKKPPAPKYFTHPLSINRDKFVRHASTYLGTPYVYGGTDKKKGLDCSGFIYNVFLHFNILPPRISKDYTYEGIQVTLEKARPGDLILFTSPGTKKSGVVGHMGIITEPYPNLHFIHSASGNSKGVIISEFKGYYVEHFVKVISVLK